jgi:hypothetical protein
MVRTDFRRRGLFTVLTTHCRVGHTFGSKLKTRFDRLPQAKGNYRMEIPLIIYSNDLVSSDIIIETDDEGIKREIIIDWIAGVGEDDVVDTVVVEGYYEDNGDEFSAHYTGNEMLNVLRR